MLPCVIQAGLQTKLKTFTRAELPWLERLDVTSQPPPPEEGDAEGDVQDDFQRELHLWVTSCYSSIELSEWNMPMPQPSGLLGVPYCGCKPSPWIHRSQLKFVSWGRKVHFYCPSTLTLRMQFRWWRFLTNYVYIDYNFVAVSVYAKASCKAVSAALQCSVRSVKIV